MYYDATQTEVCAKKITCKCKCYLNLWIDWLKYKIIETRNAFNILNSTLIPTNLQSSWMLLTEWSYNSGPVFKLVTSSKVINRKSRVPITSSYHKFLSQVPFKLWSHYILDLPRLFRLDICESWSWWMIQWIFWSVKISN